MNIFKIIFSMILYFSCCWLWMFLWLLKRLFYIIGKETSNVKRKLIWLTIYMKTRQDLYTHTYICGQFIHSYKQEINFISFKMVIIIFISHHLNYQFEIMKKFLNFFKHMHTKNKSIQSKIISFMILMMKKEKKKIILNKYIDLNNEWIVIS